jgi:hypothetical protein
MKVNLLDDGMDQGSWSMCPAAGETSAEGECKRLDTGIEEIDRERPSTISFGCRTS